MSLKQTIIDRVADPALRDQEPEGKNAFLQTGKYEKTRLVAVGISNGVLKKSAAEISRNWKSSGIAEVLPAVDSLMRESQIFEEQLLAILILENFRKHFDRETFTTIDSWIDSVDYWAISDHLSLNIMGNFPLEEPWYKNRLAGWLSAPGYWRRRQGLTAFIVRARKLPELLEPVLSAVEQLLGDDNYYIRKAIPWTIREAYRRHPENHGRVFEFLNTHIGSFNKTMLREAMGNLSREMQDELLQVYAAER